MAAKVMRIERIGLAVADLERALDFYSHGLGFQLVTRKTRRSEAFTELLGIPAVQADAAVLRLGEQFVELLQFEPPGQPYPTPRAANDPWFQHFAIIVADMAPAYRQLSTQDPQAISRGGPQLLPPSTGSVTAYKFRDPDGNPLELSYLPTKIPDPDEHAKAPSPNFLRIDHSAIAVRDLNASLAFYCGLLGMSLGERFLNVGVEQDRLDGLDGAEVDILALYSSEPGPHIELLHYRAPAPAAVRAPLAPNDIGATRLVMSVDDLGVISDRLFRSDVPIVSKGLVERNGSRNLLVRDPDDHLIELVS
ncbi:VOC family protein [Caulobacter sp. S45]|uniref:VOC family protein n=1 Tax=Caulobacter sp. S45 TaxID=1641861 RepID=UPI00131BB9EE|nr:VOC family protein [Caulobacter sp. S45]